MRFDDYVSKHHLVVSPVDSFHRFFVEVGVPPGWEPFESVRGMRIWVCRTLPRGEEFCANAVLTMHAIEEDLSADAVFAMLAEQQLQSVPGCREVRRELVSATEGVGMVGALAIQVASEFGAIDSLSRSRIIAEEQETLIAQLTVTTLRDSPGDGSRVWLTVRSGSSEGSASAYLHGAASTADPEDGN